MTTTRITIKCGCGTPNPIANLAAELACTNCKTPLITEKPATNRHVRTLSLSRQCDLTVVLDSTPVGMIERPGMVKG